MAQKEGYEETSAQDQRNSSTERSSRDDNNAQEPRQPRQGLEDPEPARPHPLTDPFVPRGQSNRPLPEPIPGFEDEYEINRPPGNPWGFPGGRNPYRIGDDDLNPPGLGRNPPLRGPFFGEEEGNGMHVGPGHPIFGGRQGGGGGGGIPDPR